jgi:hypothetical protein
MEFVRLASSPEGAFLAVWWKRITATARSSETMTIPRVLKAPPERVSDSNKPAARHDYYRIWRGNIQEKRGMAGSKI